MDTVICPEQINKELNEYRNLRSSAMYFVFSVECNDRARGYANKNSGQAVKVLGELPRAQAPALLKGVCLIGVGCLMLAPVMERDALVLES